MARPSRQAEGRLEILESAAEALATVGFHGMTMRALAAGMGRSLTSFYTYFRSKEDLLFDLQLRAFETLLRSAEQATVEVIDPSDRLFAFILQHVRYVADKHSVMQVLVQEAGTLPPSRRRPIREAKERYFQFAQALVGEVVRMAGRDDDPIELERQTYALFGMLNWTYGWYEPARHGEPRELARTIHRLLLRGLGGPNIPDVLIGTTAEPPLAPLLAPTQKVGIHP